MAFIQLGNLGDFGFRPDLFGTYDFFDYDFQTMPLPTGVRIFGNAQNYTEVTGANIGYSLVNGTIFGLTSGSIFSIKQVTNGVTIFEATGINIPASVLSDLVSYGTADQGLRYLMSQNDTVIGSQASDTLYGGTGANFLNGGDGFDTALYRGNSSEYRVKLSADGSVRVLGNETQDTLTSVERFQFDDGLFTQDAILAKTKVIPSNGSQDSLYDVSRFYNTKTGAHFYTANDAERDSLIANSDLLVYEGNAFDSGASSASGLAVYRFYNEQTGVHFYTASEQERQAIQANLPRFLDEGLSYFAYAEGGVGRQALHRFYNTENGTHFYTANEQEQLNVSATLPHYRYEGIGYYVDIA